MKQYLLTVITMVAATFAATAQPTSSLGASAKGTFNTSSSFKCWVHLNGNLIHSTKREAVAASPEVELKEGDRITIKVDNNGVDPRHFQLIFMTPNGKRIDFRRNHYKIIPTVAEVTDFDPANAREWKMALEASDRAKFPFPFRTQADSVWGEGKVSYLAIIVTRDMLNTVK